MHTLRLVCEIVGAFTLAATFQALVWIGLHWIGERVAAARDRRVRRAQVSVVSGGPTGSGKCRPRPPGRPQDHPALRDSDGGAA